MPTTTNLSITIPTVGGDNATWGGIANAAFQSLDDVFVSNGTGTSVGLNVGSGKTLALAGTQTVTGTLNASGGALTLPQGSSPAPTGEGAIAWDTDDNLLHIGDGAGSAVFGSGSYTPTATGVANVTALTTTTCYWSRSGSVVHVHGSINVDPTASSTTTTFRITLPIASTLSTFQMLAGSGNSLLNFENVPIQADIVNNAAQFSFIPLNNAAQHVNFVFSYVVV